MYNKSEIGKNVCRTTQYIGGMTMKQTKNLSGAKFYIALSCCVLVIAMIGYVGKFANNKSTEPNVNVSEVVNVEDTQTPPPIATTAPIKTATPIPKKQNTAKAVSKPVELETTTPPTTQKQEKPIFDIPTTGTIAQAFSGDTLIYNKALSDWRTHDGVDIQIAAGADVKVSLAGTVIEVYSNELGECILVDHKNGYTSLYAGLENTDMVSVGKELAKGDVIGKVAQKSIGENVTDTHLHFELMKDGTNIDPTTLISFNK